MQPHRQKKKRLAAGLGSFRAADNCKCTRYSQDTRWVGNPVISSAVLISRPVSNCTSPSVQRTSSLPDQTERTIRKPQSRSSGTS
ncbi:hypothetical protein M3J09_006041 [Ascochyta lentis]